ncbi:DUF1349 domain-containing protein [Microbacterium sp. MPKO10]|uniref:beta-xylosidase family glycoside hydrolase n=1 Tax=Microbacterium sp. MPKO10 TaxID=2989818 RepID=UPI002236A680|nr:DUF1349 domain-containing protein [Microbacterium sp. MPKO10]MCW4459964.1 DUF1349 domain-containing protein [Microbacterium sp. MPKO10]
MSIRQRLAAIAAATALIVTGFATTTVPSAVAAVPEDENPLPVFTLDGPIIDKDNVDTWNPGHEFIFPSVFHASEYLDEPLAEWYVYYAPHDAPGGINLMYSDSLDGPWTQYESNPLIRKTWGDNYDVSHVSAPDAVWNDETGELFLYFHGENTTDRYATSTDGVTFDYGGVVMTTEQFGQDATETSYNRIFENPFPANGWEYAMFFMVNDTTNVRRIGLAYSHDMVNWEAQPGWVVEPGVAEGTNVAGPEIWQWDGKTYVLYGSSTGTIFAKQLDSSLHSFGESLPLYVPGATPPQDGRASSPQIITVGDKTHMIFEIGGRSGTTIAHATLDPDGIRDPLNTRPEDPMYEKCTGEGSDEFDGTALGDAWSVVRDDESRYSVADGSLTMSSSPTSIDGATLPQLPVSADAWEVTTKLTYAPEEKYQQAGLMLYRDDLNNAKLTWGFAKDGQRIDFTWKNKGKDRFDGWAWEDSLFPPADMGDTIWLRMTSDGEWITAAASTNGETFTTVGRPIAADELAATAIGPAAYRGDTGAPDTPASFDWLRFTPTDAELAACAESGTDPGEDPGTDPGDDDQGDDDQGNDDDQGENDDAGDGDSAATLSMSVAHQTLERGETQTVVASGFEPGESVTGTMHSTPLDLGSQTADADGDVTFSWTIPADTSVGVHSAVLTGEVSGEVSADFRVSADQLAATGANAAPWLWAGALMLLVGAAALTVGRLRGRSAPNNRS